MRYRYLLTLTQPRATEALKDAIAAGFTEHGPGIAVEELGTEGAPGPVTVHFTEAEARAILHVLDLASHLAALQPANGTPTLAAGIRKLSQLTPKPWTGPLQEG